MVVQFSTLDLHGAMPLSELNRRKVVSVDSDGLRRLRHQCLRSENVRVARPDLNDDEFRVRRPRLGGSSVVVFQTTI